MFRMEFVLYCSECAHVGMYPAFLSKCGIVPYAIRNFRMPAESLWAFEIRLLILDCCDEERSYG